MERLNEKNYYVRWAVVFTVEDEGPKWWEGKRTFHEIITSHSKSGEYFHNLVSSEIDKISDCGEKEIEAIQILKFESNHPYYSDKIETILRDNFNYSDEDKLCELFNLFINMGENAELYEVNPSRNFEIIEAMATLLNNAFFEPYTHYHGKNNGIIGVLENFEENFVEVFLLKDKDDEESRRLREFIREDFAQIAIDLCDHTRNAKEFEEKIEECRNCSQNWLKKLVDWEDFDTGLGTLIVIDRYHFFEK